MLRYGNEPVSMGDLNHPMVEAEVAFLLKKDLRGPGISEAQVISATEGVFPSLEIIDTRYERWSQSVICSVADMVGVQSLVLGGTMSSLPGLDLRFTGMIFEKNGEIIDTAAGASVMGNPVTSVAWLVNRLASFGTGFKAAGDIIMSGSLIRSIPVRAGDILKASFDRLGEVGIRVTE